MYLNDDELAWLDEHERRVQEGIDLIDSIVSNNWDDAKAIVIALSRKVVSASRQQRWTGETLVHAAAIETLAASIARVKGRGGPEAT
jgi:hypothetical protein